ncbi:hypothetical protein [Aliidiomarina sp.]|uniref:hypothetical protein n=1 Tax=Aliidiomarina sp. TaxID=1872439 RepID=UPI003A4E29FF
MIHIIFIPIIAALLLAWGYFGKLSAMHTSATDSPEHSMQQVAEGGTLTQGKGQQQSSARPKEDTLEQEYARAQRAYQYDTDRHRIADLEAKIAAVRAELDVLEAHSEQSATAETMRLNQLLADFATGIQNSRHSDINEFATSEPRPDTQRALTDFLVANEHVRNLGIQVGECKAFGCELHMNGNYHATQPITQVMQLNRAMIEHGESEFGQSSLHLVGHGAEQRLLLVWH